MKKNRDKPSAQPDKAARQAEEKRFARAEQACRRILDILALEAMDALFASAERAGQYAGMCRIHARKLRNGKVISPADFNAAVEVCTAAERCRQAVPESTLAAHAACAPLLAEMLENAAVVQEDMRRLKTAQR
ncbi:hypothetical protein [uncultured Aquitalea sp.]|uniref:hypothetical protein n=1 Tax=uncultured Aquitalea sp. TaxID=540272 RepID=UPI0025F8D9CC|nr:hypothetical protein [uncultured Aquitalea sp.]